MPELFKQPLRMDCKGIDLVHPLDRMPAGYFPYLFNTRVIQEGILEGRPGYSTLLTCQKGDLPNSIRRLNDPAQVYSALGYEYVGGGGSSLYFGDQAKGYVPIDTGYSGNPLSLIPFRPDQDIVDWMYAYDANKQIKVRPDGTMRSIGLAPPSTAPAIEYGEPSYAMVNPGQDSTGWTVDGSIATAISQQDRTGGAAPTIANIIYNSGTSGWCCINPSSAITPWMGDRMGVILSGGTETVVVREVHQAIQPTQIQGIQYDSGTTGACSIVLGGSPTDIDRNSLIQLLGEIVRVTAVILSPDGSTYSIRCSTANTHAAGEAVTGLLSWYVYTYKAHSVGESITSVYLQVSQSGAGAGVASLSTGVNAQITTNSRSIDPANDYLHISIYLSNPLLVTNLQILLTLDATPNFSFTNPGNSYIFTLTQDQLLAAGASSSSWCEVIIPISTGVRSGNDQTRGLWSVTGIGLQLTTTDACTWGFDWWYLFGTYGPTILPNSPTGTQYQVRYRDSSTGAHSVPGPLNRQALFPLRESVIITPTPTTQAGVDQIDVYRLGGTVDSPLYDQSIINNPGDPNYAVDSLDDTAILEANQVPDTAALQPWPLLAKPMAGTCKVNGTSVEWLTGDKFNTALIGGTVILIAGQAFQLYGPPSSATVLQLMQSGGFNGNASFLIASPTLAGQPLPFVFGPLEGPFAPTVLGLGDPLNGGNLYFTNFSDADGASDANSLELAGPGNDLISGAVWKGMVFAGNKDEVFCVRFTYLTTIGASSNQSFQWYKINAPSGIWSRWACCACPAGVAYLGRDGIYIATDAGAVNISDEQLYPLFPHDGEPARAVNQGSNIILPVDMTADTFLRLTYCDGMLRFSYPDTDGNWNTLIYELAKKRWMPDHYADPLSLHYLVELDSKGTTGEEILSLDVGNGLVVLMGGNTDNGKDIDSIVLTPSLDNGDERAQKLYVDSMVQADGTGEVQVAFAYDNAVSFSPVQNFTVAGSVAQYILPIDSQSDLELHRNIACKLFWTGGPGGPRIYAWETAGYPQPMLVTRLVTQFISLSFPGWKHMRRMFAALISTSPILFTIETQDGRTYGPYTVPSTGGQYRQLPQMLDGSIKDLAFSLQMDGQGKSFAPFLEEWIVEVKEWQEETYIKLACFKA